MKAQRGNKKKTRVERPAVARAAAAPSVPVNWPAAIAVLVLTFLVYLPTLRFQFVYDDVEQIVNNPNVQSWSFLPDYFTKSLWSQGGWYQVRFYRPFFLLWLRINHALFGLDTSYWHLTTIAAHLLATLLVYLLVQMLLKKWVPAAFAALFFGLHPIHTQVVAWVSSVSEALLAAALIGALICYIKSAKKRDIRWLAGSLACYASALLMKETALVFPAIIFSFAWLWFDEKESAGRTWFAFAQTLPFVALAAIYLLVRWSVLKGIVTAAVPLGFKTIVLSIPSLILFYGKLLFWPVDLSPSYDTPLVKESSFSHFILPALVIVAVVCVVVLLLWKTWKATDEDESSKAEGRLAVFACVWTIVFILPALYLPALQDAAYIQDRYIYIPSVGFSILLGLGISKLGRSSKKILGIPWAQAAASLVLAGVMAIDATAQSKIWSDNVTLFTRAVERAPNNRLSQHNLAASLVDTHRYADAIKLLQKLLNEDPNDLADNNNIGQAYLNLKDGARAEPYLTRACQLRPTAKQYYQLGAVRFNLGRMQPAEQAFRQAIAMDPNGVDFHYVLGLTLERLNQPEAALEAFRKDLSIYPNDTKSQQELARLSAALQHLPPKP